MYLNPLPRTTSISRPNVFRRFIQWVAPTHTRQGYFSFLESPLVGLCLFDGVSSYQYLATHGHALGALALGILLPLTKGTCVNVAFFAGAKQILQRANAPRPKALVVAAATAAGLICGTGMWSAIDTFEKAAIPSPCKTDPQSWACRPTPIFWIPVNVVGR